jgi:hypothetical protein
MFRSLFSGNAGYSTLKGVDKMLDRVCPPARKQYEGDYGEKLRLFYDDPHSRAGREQIEIYLEPDGDRLLVRIAGWGTGYASYFGNPASVVVFILGALDYGSQLAPPPRRSRYR